PCEPAQLAFFEPWSEGDLRGREVAVDEDPLSGPHLAEEVLGGEVAVRDRLGGGAAAVGIRGRRVAAYLAFAEELGDVAEGGQVGDAGEDDLGPVVGDDGWRAVAAVDGVDVGHVLEEGDELNPLPGTGGGEGGELAQGRNVGTLVEDEEQWRVERPYGLGRALGGVGDDLLDEGREQVLQPALLVARVAEVGGVVAAVEEVLGAEL